MDKSKTTDPVRRLTDQEIADLRADMQQAAEWTRKELARRRKQTCHGPANDLHNLAVSGLPPER